MIYNLFIYSLVIILRLYISVYIPFVYLNTDLLHVSSNSYMDSQTKVKDSPEQFSGNENKYVKPIDHEKRLSLSASQDSATPPTDHEDAYLKPVDHDNRLSLSASQDSAIQPTGNEDDYFEPIEDDARHVVQQIHRQWPFSNANGQMNNYNIINPDGHNGLSFENKDGFHLSCDDSVYLQNIGKEAGRINSSITRNDIQNSAHSMCTLDQILLAVIVI